MLADIESALPSSGDVSEEVEEEEETQESRAGAIQLLFTILFFWTRPFMSLLSPRLTRQSLAVQIKPGAGKLDQAPLSIRVSRPGHESAEPPSPSASSLSDAQTLGLTGGVSREAVSPSVKALGAAVQQACSAHGAAPPDAGDPTGTADASSLDYGGDPTTGGGGAASRESISPIVSCMIGEGTDGRTGDASAPELLALAAVAVAPGADADTPPEAARASEPADPNPSGPNPRSEEPTASGSDSSSKKVARRSAGPSAQAEGRKPHPRGAVQDRSRSSSKSDAPGLLAGAGGVLAGVATLWPFGGAQGKGKGKGHSSISRQSSENRGGSGSSSSTQASSADASSDDSEKPRPREVREGRR